MKSKRSEAAIEEGEVFPVGAGELSKSDREVMGGRDSGPERPALVTHAVFVGLLFVLLWLLGQRTTTQLSTAAAPHGGR